MWHETQSFSGDLIRKAWKRQGGKCARCGKKLLTENQDKGTVGAWHPHPKQRRIGYDIVDNCVLLCIDKPEDCHFNVGHEAHHLTTYAELQDWDLPYLYAGTRNKHSNREYRNRVWEIHHPNVDE